MSKKKILLFIVLCFIYNVTMSTFYRPYIYSNKINDFGIADIGNNITFIPAVYFITYLFNGRYLASKYYDLYIQLGFLVSLEAASYFFHFLGTFDLKDIFGASVGTIITHITLVKCQAKLYL